MSSASDRYPNDERRHPAEAGYLALEIGRLAPSRATVLLVGGSPEESATIARALHDRSPRALRPFVAVDCAGFPDDEVEGVLFGGPMYHLTARGAVHAAERGTLYVASIEALPLPLQPRFLRFLDEGESVRVVVSSQVDLTLRVVEGRFRKDLGERLDLVRVVVARAR